MKIRNILDNLKKPFEKGQKLEKLYPAFDAFETFLFVPNHTSKTGAHIRDAIDLKRVMITVIIALLPALFYGIYNTGYQYLVQLPESFTTVDAIILWSSERAICPRTHTPQRYGLKTITLGGSSVTIHAKPQARECLRSLIY